MQPIDVLQVPLHNPGFVGESRAFDVHSEFQGARYMQVIDGVHFGPLANTGLLDPGPDFLITTRVFI